MKALRSVASHYVYFFCDFIPSLFSEPASISLLLSFWLSFLFYQTCSHMESCQPVLIRMTNQWSPSSITYSNESQGHHRFFPASPHSSLLFICLSLSHPLWQHIHYTHALILSGLQTTCCVQDVLSKLSQSNEISLTNNMNITLVWNCAKP